MNATERLAVAIECASDCRTAKEAFEAANSRIDEPIAWPTWRRDLSDNPEQKEALYAALLKPEPVRISPPADTDFDAERYFELSVAANDEWQKRHPDNTRTEISIGTDKPIGVVFTSDWHVGGPGTEHLQIRADNQTIAAHPQLFAYVGGDWANNFVLPSLAHAGNEDVFTAGDSQYEIVLYLLQFLLDANSVLAIGDGNHTDWTKRMSGIDPRAHLLRDVPHLYTVGGSLMTLAVGEQAYKIFRRHRQRFSSVFNPGHAVVAEYQRNPFDFDIGVIEHQHEPFFGGFPGKERDDGSTWRIAVRPGTYKIHDKYADVGGYWNASEELIAVILHPDRFWMQPVRGLQNAIDVLDGLG